MPTQQKAADLLRSVLEGAISLNAWNGLVESAGSRLDLTGIHLQGVTLSGFTFRECDMDGARLEECRLARVCFDDASLVGASFRGSNLDGSTFVRASAREADFRGCHLEGANLSWCDLQGARLEGIDLSTANLWKTDLRNATYEQFEVEEKQHVLTDRGRLQEDDHTEVPLNTVLRTLGAMLGVPYRWVGKNSVSIEVRFPNRIEDPATVMAEILVRHRLHATPHTDDAGQITHFEVST